MGPFQSSAYLCSPVSWCIFTPGKSFSMLSFIWTKIQWIFFGLVVSFSRCNFLKSPGFDNKPTRAQKSFNNNKQNRLGQGIRWNANIHGAPSCCTCTAHHDLFQTITRKMVRHGSFRSKLGRGRSEVSDHLFSPHQSSLVSIHISSKGPQWGFFWFCPN